MNEDAVFTGRQLVVVADGLGGHNAGDVASALVVERLAQLDRSPLTADALCDAVAAANGDLLGHAADHPEAEGLGTTVSGVGLVEVSGVEHWAVFNIGDSRVYRYAGGTLARATTDHSETEELLLSGRLVDAEEVSPVDRSVITRALGSDPAPTLDLWLLPVVGDEQFVVCSDGLWSEVPDERMTSVLARNRSPQETCSALVDEALRAGGSDNISVVVVGRAVDEVAEVQSTRPRPRQHVVGLGR